MKKILIVPGILTFLFFACNNAPQQAESPAPAQPSKEDIVKRGEYLVSTSGCHDCHTPKQPSGMGLELIREKLLSGYPADRPVMKPDQRALKQGWVLINHDITQAAGPWGVSFSAIPCLCRSPPSLIKRIYLPLLKHFFHILAIGAGFYLSLSPVWCDEK